MEQIHSKTNLFKTPFIKPTSLNQRTKDRFDPREVKCLTPSWARSNYKTTAKVPIWCQATTGPTLRRMVVRALALAVTTTMWSNLWPTTRRLTSQTSIPLLSKSTTTVRSRTLAEMHVTHKSQRITPTWWCRILRRDPKWRTATASATIRLMEAIQISTHTSTCSLCRWQQDKVMRGLTRITISIDLTRRRRVVNSFSNSKMVTLALLCYLRNRDKAWSHKWMIHQLRSNRSWLSVPDSAEVEHLYPSNSSMDYLRRRTTKCIGAVKLEIRCRSHMTSPCPIVKQQRKILCSPTRKDRQHKVKAHLWAI